MSAGLICMPVRTPFTNVKASFSPWEQNAIPQNHYFGVIEPIQRRKVCGKDIPFEMAGGEWSGRKMAGRIVGVLGPKSRMWVSFRFAVSQPMGAIPSDDGTGADSCGNIFAEILE